MSKKMPPLSVLKDFAAEKGVELPDDVLDSVAGGVYPEDEWNALPPAERERIIQISMLNKFILKIPCDLD